jgi:acyl-CoA dehydrogenase
MKDVGDLELARDIAARVEQFVRRQIVPYERDSRIGPHGPSDELVRELRALAANAHLLTPHLLSDGAALSHRCMAPVFRAAGLSPLGPVALNIAAPDEGNMVLLKQVASSAQQARFLKPLIEGRIRSAFLMTEPAEDNGAGSDPSMLKTQAHASGGHWVINGRKAFITGLSGAGCGIVMAMTETGPTLFLTELPHPAVRIERIFNTLDRSMPGGHALVKIENLKVSQEDVLGEVGGGFKYAQVRLAPARLTHCMRWLGACTRADEIATHYATRREAFGKILIEHEGVGFMLADNRIDLKQTELMVDWCADVLDRGAGGTLESSMTKVAVSEALFRVADRCVQVLGGIGVTNDTIVEQVFREVRAFRIYDGPTEVHKWSIARKIRRDALGRE